MKKLLKVSLMAMLVAAPFAANAADIAAATKETVTPVADVASTSYVKGAYNAAIDEINTNRTQINANTTAIATKQDQLKNDAGTPADIASTVKTSVAATGSAVDTALVTEKAVRDAIDAAKSATTYTQGSGIAIDANNEISASGITTSNIAANAGILKTQLAQGVQDSLDLADTALQASTAASTGTVDLTKSDYTAGTIGAALYSINQTATDAVTDSELEAAIQGLDGTTANTSLAESNGVLTVQVDTTHITRDASGNLTLSSDDATAIADVANKANAADLGDKDNLSNDFTAAQKADVVTAVNAAMAEAKTAGTAKYVTVHTTWGADSTTASANVLTTTAPASGS